MIIIYIIIPYYSPNQNPRAYSRSCLSVEQTIVVEEVLLAISTIKDYCDHDKKCKAAMCEHASAMHVQCAHKMVLHFSTAIHGQKAVLETF